MQSGMPLNEIPLDRTEISPPTALYWPSCRGGAGPLLELADDKNLSPPLQPQPFKNLLQEVLFVASIAASQLILEVLVTGFIALLPAVSTDPHTATWLSSSFSLAIASLLLPMGRVVDRYDVAISAYIAGMIWIGLWCLVCGCTGSMSTLILCRTMQGIGSAVTLPAGLKSIGMLYSPGRRKNLVFSIYSSMAPGGALLGMLLAGLIDERSWFFLTTSMISMIVSVVCWLTRPKLRSVKQNIRLDWKGMALSAAATSLLVLSVTQAVHSRIWPAITAAASLVLLIMWWSVERRAEDPLVPTVVLRRMSLLFTGLFVSFGTVGVYTLYAVLYLKVILHVSGLMMVAWFLPMLLGGFLLAIAGSHVLPLISGTAILCISSWAIMGSSLLFVLMPAYPSYWIWIFPSMGLAALAIDLTMGVASVYLSTALPAHQQGLAGALISVIVQLSISSWLGVADIIVASTGDLRHAFWLEFACGCVSLHIFAFFVNVERAK